jgi:hypothetical protein
MRPGKSQKKILEYKYLTTEVQRMWNIKTKVISLHHRGNSDHFKVIQTVPNNILG